MRDLTKGQRLSINRRGLLAGAGGFSLLGVSALAQTQPSYIFRNVFVFDGAGGARLPRNVRVTGTRIDAISTGDIPARDGVTVIDGQGHTLMPGLSDAHNHMGDVKGSPTLGSDDGFAVAMVLRDAEAQLLRGFTTVRDLADLVFGVKRAIDNGVSPGPRVYSSGAPISQTSGHGDFGAADDVPVALGGAPHRASAKGMMAVADGVPGVLAATRLQLKRGASQIKIMAGGGVTSPHDPIDVTQYTAEEMRAIVQAASDWGTYVTAHAYTVAAVRRCIDAGVRCIEHGHSIDDKTAALMAEKDVWLSTQPFQLSDFPLTPEMRAKAQEAVTGGWQASVKLAKKHGVKVAFGTDIGNRTPESRFGNLLLPRLGEIYSNAEVLRIATAGNAELFALSGMRNPYRAAALGVIREGAWADMVLVRGNPLEDLRLISDPARNMLVVMKDGVIYKNMLPA